MNNKKSEAMWIGSEKNNKEKPFNIKWSEEPIKSLGVYYTYDKAKSIKLNFEIKLKKMEKRCNGGNPEDNLY